MITVDGENYDKEGKHFSKIIEKLDKVLKYIFSQLRICRDDVIEIMMKDLVEIITGNTPSKKMKSSGIQEIYVL